MSAALAARYASEIAEAAYQAGQLIDDGLLMQLLQHCSSALSSDTAAPAAAEASAPNERNAECARAHLQTQQVPSAADSVNAVDSQPRLLCHRRQPRLAGRTLQTLRTQLAGRWQKSLELMRGSHLNSEESSQGRSGARGGHAQRQPLWRCNG
jgi:hypothetical protein